MRSFSDLVKTNASRVTFAQSISAFLTKYNFDGVDLDWEANSANDVYSKDMANYVVSAPQPLQPHPAPLL